MKMIFFDGIYPNYNSPLKEGSAYLCRKVKKQKTTSFC